MHNRNTFEGIRYRVQETLSKQPNNVPLTAREVAQRLQESEYKGELFDTVLHRVTTALHALYNKGAVSKTPHHGGYSTYNLTVRTTFTPPNGAPPPANPVISPDLATKLIESIKPQPPEPKVHPMRANVVEGSQDKVLQFVKGVSKPVTVAEVFGALRDLYTHMTDLQAKDTFAAHIYNLHKQKRIKRVRVTGRGSGIRYAYYTSRKQLDAVEGLPVLEVIAAAPKPAPVAKAGLFRPVAPVQLEQVEVKLNYTVTEHARVEASAKTFGVSIDAFIKQAVEFAMGNLDA